MSGLQRKVLSRQAAQERQVAAEKESARRKQACLEAQARTELRTKIPRLLRRLNQLNGPDAVVGNFPGGWGRRKKRAAWVLYTTETFHIDSNITYKTYLLANGRIYSSSPWNSESERYTSKYVTATAVLDGVNKLIAKYGA